MKKYILIILVAILCLTGCSDVTNEGEITEKIHEGAWTQTMMMPMTISNGKTSTTMLVPFIIYHPENFKIIVKNTGIHRDETGEMETLYEDFYLTEEVFNSVHIGEWFVYDESFGYREEQIIKERQ